MAEEREVDVLWRGVCLDDAVDFFGLPVDDAGHHEGKTATGMLLLQPISAIQSSPVAVFEIACQGVNLLSFEQAAPVPFSHLRIGHKVQSIFSTHHTA